MPRITLAALLMAIALLIPLRPSAAEVSFSPVQVVCEINLIRTKNGLPLFGYDTKLTSAAQTHSADQAKMNRVTHLGSDGSTPGNRVTRTGYDWVKMDEIVVANYKAPTELIAALMKSTMYQNIILSKEHKEMGPGMARNTQGVSYWTLEFAVSPHAPSGVPVCP